MMQEIFERIDNDNLFFLTIVGVLAVFVLLSFLFAERFSKKKRKWYNCAACGEVVNYLTPSRILKNKGVCEECADEEWCFAKDHEIKI